MTTSVSQPGTTTLERMQQHCEAAGLQSLSVAVAQLRAARSTASALRAAYVASESAATLSGL